MRLLVVGGKLQGTEACYLADKAGIETVLVDRHEAPPAAGLAGRHIVADITADETLARALFSSVDAVLPACEDIGTLEWLAARAPAWGVPLLFDLPAYRVTVSKLASRRLFDELGVPLPHPWPGCRLPVVVKPDSASGSESVSLCCDEAEVTAAVEELRAAGHEAVIEEYVPGPSLSLEVLCWEGRAVPLQVTGLEFDAAYDCKRVTAPVDDVSAGALEALNDVTVRLAEGLGLRGLMDVEVMVAADGPRVLEIDARLPSQTPTAVFWSSGLNMLEAYLAMVLRGALPALDHVPRRACVYQHVHAAKGCLVVLGEHVMGSALPLIRVPGFFGVDEALTDYRRGSDVWSATLVAYGDTVDLTRRRVDEAVREMARHEGLELVPES